MRGALALLLGLGLAQFSVVAQDPAAPPAGDATATPSGTVQAGSNPPVDAAAEGTATAATPPEGPATEAVPAEGMEGAATEALPAGEAGAEVAAEAAPEAPPVPVKPMAAELMPLAAKSLLLDIAFNGAQYIAVGDRGNVVASLDGAKWAQVEVPVRAALTAIHFVDGKSGWAVGHDAAIVTTRDGGNTWALQNFQPELEKPFLDVLFLDANRGFAVGAYGLFLQTADGGGSWAEVDAPAIRDEELHFNSIIRLANGQLFIAGESGMLAVSADEGVTWERLTSPYESSLFGALPVGPAGALVYGLRGNVFIADDVRGQWRKIDTGTVASMFGGAALPAGGFVLVGLGGAIVTTDGQAVTLTASPVGKTLSAVVPVDGAVLAVGEAGAELLSTR